MPGGGLGHRRELWLGTSQSRNAKRLPLPPESVTAGKEPRQLQGISGESWGSWGEDGGSGMKKNKASEQRNYSLITELVMTLLLWAMALCLSSDPKMEKWEPSQCCQSAWASMIPAVDVQGMGGPGHLQQSMLGTKPRRQPQSHSFKRHKRSTTPESSE